jgi:hypothetical protein
MVLIYVAFLTGVAIISSAAISGDASSARL